ncbi:hypothetical protein AB0I81_62560 [Nonomuraea sp. NPDC050404]|uniref:hypothetical protein n=1 Tax=Nonomuraea sp. NPDC050404 TaxID=3155783 RepID=UPI0033DB3E14
MISPLLLNIALHGLEEAAGVRYRQAAGVRCGEAMPGSPLVIRYADDLIVLCHSQRQAQQVKAAVAEWLTPRVWPITRARPRSSTCPQGVTSWGSTSDATATSC